jgi:UDP-glucuronate 4-epimerase
VKLGDFIKAIEMNLGKKAIIQYQPMQAGDVRKTWADITSLRNYTGITPKTPVETGIRSFISWYRSFYSQG